MTEKTLLIIEPRLMGKIDDNRGDLGRAEFIEFCVNTCFEKAELEPKMPLRKVREEVYTIGEKFGRRQHSLKSPLVINRGLMEKIDENRGDLSRTEFIEFCVNTCFGRAEPEPKTPLRKVREEAYTIGEELGRRQHSLKSPLVIDRELIEKIDGNRGDLSRAEFIELCANTWFEEAEPEPKMTPREARGEVYATREQFERHKRSIKSLLRAFLDVLITFGLNLGRGDARRLEEDLRQRFRETMGADESELPRRVRRASSEGLYLEDEDELPPRFWGARSKRFEPEEYDDLSRRPRQTRRENYYPEEYDEPRRGSRQLADGLKQRFQAMLGREEAESPRGSWRPGSKRYYTEEYDLPQRSRREKYYPEEYELPQRPRHERYYTEEYDLPQRPRRAKIDKASLKDDADSPSEGTRQNMYFGLWIPAIALFGFGDTFLSTMVFAKGGYEANPLMASLISMFGGSMVAFVVIKTLVLAILAFISFKVFKKQGWLIPSILSAVGGYLVVTNLMAYLSL